MRAGLCIWRKESTMPRKALCSMCLETKEKTTHFDLYISGSEGVRLCHDCEMLIVEYIRESARDAFRKRRAIAREDLTGALGVAVAALRQYADGKTWRHIAVDALRELEGRGLTGADEG